MSDYTSKFEDFIEISIPIDMATPTIHMLVAKNVAKNCNLTYTGLYLLGSIAPDAVFTRAQCKKEDIDESHLRGEGIKESWSKAIEMLEINDPFSNGYAVHLMCDILWLSGPYARVNKEQGEKYKRNTFEDDLHFIERWLFRRDESRALWNAIQGTKTSSMNYYVTSGEIELYKLEKSLVIKHTKTLDTTKYFSIIDAMDFAEKAGMRIAAEINAKVK